MIHRSVLKLQRKRLETQIYDLSNKTKQKSPVSINLFSDPGTPKKLLERLKVLISSPMNSDQA